MYLVILRPSAENALNRPNRDKKRIKMQFSPLVTGVHTKMHIWTQNGSDDLK